MQEDGDEQFKLLDPMKYSEKPIVKNYRYFFRGQYNKIQKKMIYLLIENQKLN